MKPIRFVLFSAVKSEVFAGFKIYHSQNNCNVYFTLSLMYMPSFIAVSVVVFKLLPVKVWQPTYLCFFPLCKLKILPTLRTRNFKSKSQSCLEKNKCKD